MVLPASLLDSVTHCHHNTGRSKLEKVGWHNQGLDKTKMVENPA